MEVTGDLAGNKIAEKTTNVSKSSPKIVQKQLKLKQKLQDLIEIYLEKDIDAENY